MSIDRATPDRISMSQQERDVLKVMQQVLAGTLTQVEAARLLRLSTRQVRRLRRRLEAEGDQAVVHRLRGRPSNRRIGDAPRQKILAAYRRDYPDFGPTFASAKLAEQGLAVRITRGGAGSRAGSDGPMTAAIPTLAKQRPFLLWSDSDA
jgi:hypothetical protein